jgi:hypothetical protein
MNTKLISLNQRKTSRLKALYFLLALPLALLLTVKAQLAIARSDHPDESPGQARAGDEIERVDTALDSSNDTIQAAYNQYMDELNIIYTILNESTYRREVWFKSIGEATWSSQIGFSGWDESVCVAITPGTGLPAVAYRDQSGSLVFAQWANSAWITQTVSTWGMNCSLAFDPNDNHPAIAFNSVGDYNLYYAKWNGSTWSVSLLSWLDADYESLRFHPMTKELYISFETLGWTNHPSSLYLWHTGSPSGYVDSGADYVGGGNALAFDKTGYPHVTYFDKTNRTLKHAWRNGFEWNFQVLDDRVDCAYGITSLAISVDNQIYVSYPGHYGGLDVAYFDGRTWHAIPLVTIPNSYYCRQSSLVLDDQGTAYMAYVMNGDARVIAVPTQFLHLPLIMR